MWNETFWVFERIKLYHVMKEHPDWSKYRLGKVLGHDPKWVDRWIKSYHLQKTPCLEMFQSQSRARKKAPQRVSEDTKQLIGQMRIELSEVFHRRAGPKTIQYWIKKHQKQIAMPVDMPRSGSTIARILREMGYVKPQSKVQHEPLILPAPMTEWEMDFGEIHLEEWKVEFFLVVDRGTSHVVYLESSDGYNAVTALQAVAQLLLLHGCPKQLRFDRDPRLWGSWTRDSYPSPLVRFLRVMGIEPIVCPPRRPDKKPFVERCIRTLKEEWLRYFSPATRAEAYELLEAFPNYYNTSRPHQGRACQNQPPAVAFPELPSLPYPKEIVAPNAWLQSIHGRTYRRQVNSNGTIQIDRHTYTIGTAYAKQPVIAHVDAIRRLFFITLEGKIIAQKPIQGIYAETMDFGSFLRLMLTEARFIDLHRRLTWEQRSDDS